MPESNTHEVRELRYRLRQLGKDYGRASDTIYRLRGEVALLREKVGSQREYELLPQAVSGPDMTETTEEYEQRLEVGEWPTDQAVQEYRQ